MSCSYKIGKLKNFIYLVEGLEYKTIDYKVNIVKGKVYKLNADLVTLTEQESYAGRFKFTTTVNCTLNRVFDDEILKSKSFKVVVEDQKGMQFLVSPEFDASYTSEFLINSDELSYKLIFTTQSNIPVRIVSTKIIGSTEEKRPCRYNTFGIDKLFIKNIKGFEEVQFINCEYTKAFNGNYTSIEVKFTIPIEDNDWHYNLIKFPSNRWDVKLVVDADEILEYSLFPQYTRQTQEEAGAPDMFTIALKGIQEGTLIGNSSQQSQYRWVQTQQFICDKFEKYIKEEKQVLIEGVWQSTGEYRKGALIERNSKDCGYTPGLRFKWESQDINKVYECVGTNKHFQEVQYKSIDDGQTWTKTDITRAGALYQPNSVDCGYVNVKWVPVEGEYICEEYDETITWVLTDEYYCELITL